MRQGAGLVMDGGQGNAGADGLGTDKVLAVLECAAGVSGLPPKMWLEHTYGRHPRGDS